MEDLVPETEAWEDKAKGLLKAEIKKRNLTYAQVVSRLSELGVKEDERNFRNKLARGKFTAAFLLACLEAIGTDTLHLQ